MNDPFEILHDELVRVAGSARATRPTPRRAASLKGLLGSGRWLRRPLALALVLVGASASAGGLALAGTFSTTAENPQAWVKGQRVLPAQAIAPDQSADLAILRRPRVPSDALSPQQISELTDSPTAANGPNPALSRQAQGLTNGQAWVIPGDGLICFQYQAGAGALGAGTCQPDATIGDGQWPILTTGGPKAPGQTAVGGLVPDGVAQVTLTLSDGTTVAVAVHENVYLATIQGDVSSVSYTGPDGTVTINN